MQKMKINANHKKAFVIAASLFFFQLLLFLSNSFFGFLILRPVRSKLSPNVTKGTVFGISALLFQNSAVVYMITLYAIYYRLCLANEFLAKLNNDKKISEKDVVKKVKNISAFIDKICDTLELMKICYSIKLIAYALHFLFYNILCIYGWICYFFRGQSSYFDLVHCSLTFFWEIYYAPFFIWVFLFSDLIQQEGRRLIMVLNRISQNGRSIRIEKRITLTIMQINNRQYLIECGIFVINWKFLFVFMGICFSYLLIIMQFEFNGV